MTRQDLPAKEYMVLLYNKTGRRLYGHVAFYRKEHTDQEIAAKPYRASSPFVIGRYSANDKLEVLGSVVFLLEEIGRSISGFVANNKAWHAERSRLTSESEILECDFRYDQETMDFVILVSNHARNLFDLMARFNGRSISRLDYHGSPDGEVTLRELFDTLIHNRYYYFDGACVRDLFSNDFRKKKSALSGRFMGYGFDILDFVNGISEVIHEVTVKDLTQILWKRLREFTATSKPQDVISLIQNVHAFSDLLQAKIPTAGYQFMTSLMFDRLAEALEPPSSAAMAGGSATVTQQVIFEAPRIGIAGELMDKNFEIRVRCAIGGPDQKVGKEDFQEHTVSIGYQEFLSKVNEAFGDDRVLAGVSRRLVSAAVDGESE